MCLLLIIIIFIILQSPRGSGRRVSYVRAQHLAQNSELPHRCRGTSRGRTAARTVHTTLAYLCFYVYYRSVCACYYILLFGGGFCLHCGKVVSQVLPAIKTRSTTVATAAPRLLYVSHNPYIYTHPNTLHCIAATSIAAFVVIVVVVVVVVIVVFADWDKGGETHLKSKNFDTVAADGRVGVYAPGTHTSIRSSASIDIFYAFI